VALTIDLLLCVYIIAKGIYHHKWLAVVLSAIQLVLAGWFELGLAGGVEITTDLYIDQLSAIMVLIIGIIGTLICIYALGYMKDFQAHLTHQEIPADMEGEHTSEPKQRKDRRNIFFSIMFAFLAGMFALVLSNNLTWLLCAWEVTTVCSFALIGYTRTPEAIRNSFRQITLNLVGGLAFAAALVALVLGAEAAGTTPILELDKLISAGSVGSSGLFLLLPIALLCVAGFTKAAQVPFQSWLLGAMVAPTPTSALLHSSTMVKAGVFLLIKLAPCLGFDFNGMMVMLVGGITFLFCSAVAIAQTNAKRVLAYSTIANLGLIVLCAGIGTPEGTWAAIFLLILHACSKALIFCCVVTAENHIG
jgi:ech hydrogenase subunit A